MHLLRKKFKEISSAYEILSDPERRDIYDKFGVQDVQQKMHNPFQMHKRTPQVAVSRIVTMHEYFTQTHIKVQVTTKTECDKCNATGFADSNPRLCKKCNGRGIYQHQHRMGNNTVFQQVTCPDCRGKCVDMMCQDEKCDDCKYGQAKKTGDIDLPVPMIPHQRVIVQGYDDGKVDVVVETNVELPDGYGLLDDKVIYTMPINYADTMCGFKRVIDYASGIPVLIVADTGYVINPYVYYLIAPTADLLKPILLRFDVNYPNKVKISDKTIKASPLANICSILGSTYPADKSVSVKSVEKQYRFNLAELPNQNMQPDYSQRRPNNYSGGMPDFDGMPDFGDMPDFAGMPGFGAGAGPENCRQM